MADQTPQSQPIAAGAVTGAAPAMGKGAMALAQGANTQKNVTKVRVKKGGAARWARHDNVDLVDGMVLLVDEHTAKHVCDPDAWEKEKGPVAELVK
jgi:hypothetical protein